jgi:hypothetical protein
MLSGFGAKASFGAVCGVTVDVTQAVSAPVAVEVQPDGKAGAVTESKFWSQGAAVGVAVGVEVLVDVAVGVLVGVAVFVGVLVGVFVNVGVGVAPAAQGNPKIVSILTPTPAVLLSVAIRHLRRIFCPLAAGGRLTVVKIYPPELPVHA